MNAAPDGRTDRFPVCMGCHHDHGQIRMHRTQAGDGIHAVDLRQIDGQADEIGLVTFNGHEPFESRGRLSHYFETIVFEDDAQEAPRQHIAVEDNRTALRFLSIGLACRLFRNAMMAFTWRSDASMFASFNGLRI